MGMEENGPTTGVFRNPFYHPTYMYLHGSTMIPPKQRIGRSTKSIIYAKEEDGDDDVDDEEE